MQGPCLGFSITRNTGWQPIRLDAAMAFVSPRSAPHGLRCLEFIRLETASDFSVLVKMTVINHATLFCSWEREKTFILFLKTIHLIVCFPFPPGQNWIQLMMNAKLWTSSSFTPFVMKPTRLQAFYAEVSSMCFQILSLGKFK